MDNIEIYTHEQFGEIRTLTVGDEVWFVASDICNALDISNTSQAVSRLDTDERSMINIGRQGTANCVNEYGLYNLILASRKLEARSFKRWITHEVLPDIRQHGVYMTPARLEEVILNPDVMIRLATELKKAKEERDALSIENSALTVKTAVLQPKAEYFDELVDRNLLSNLRDTAKSMGVGQKDFINFLLDRGYLYRAQGGSLRPYADKNDGLFEIKESYNKKTDWRGYQTLITPKGRETFRLLLQGGVR